MQDLAKWRKAALHMPISRLIGLIYDTSGYPSHVLAMPGGAIRQANLRLLLERAIEFEETSLKGLFHFTNYIQRLYESGVRTMGAIAEPPPTDGGRVRLMTIHKSKGLEFPVVICAFLGKKFNTDDTRQPVILHPKHGVGPYYVDTKLRTRSNTLARYSLSRLTARESLSEELRCLYVALTRAKELLILTARVKDLGKAMEKWANHTTARTITLPAYYRSGVTSYLDWIMPCLLRHRNVGGGVPDALQTTPHGENAIPQLWEHPAEFRVRKHTSADFGRLQAAPTQNTLVTADRRGDLRSPEPVTILKPLPPPQPFPSKLSISEIKRLYDITSDSTTVDDFPPEFTPPAFMQAQGGITAMQMGSALHTVTEHLDYHTHTTLPAIEGLIANLTARNLLTPEEADCINRDKIVTLANSPLAERIRNSAKVSRETPFILAIPAVELYPDALASGKKTPEIPDILVHGIIDCFFEENGEIVLVDYKSDAQPERHKTQLDIYKKAVASATAMKVKEVLIYSFALDGTILLP